MKNTVIMLSIVCSIILLSFKSINYKDIKDTKIEKFLIEMNDARMMDREEGKQAVEKGTNQEIKNYGNLIIKDQTFLLEELQKFAKTKNIKLKTEISKKKQKGLKDLKEKNGKKFDKKFISMICLDHKRDVRKFREATKSEDIELSNFAKKHLPMIKKHLAEIKAIKKAN